MFAVVVTFSLKPETVAGFIDLVMHNAETSRVLEPGCLRFDVLTDPARPNEVFLYELYASAADFEAHLASRHYHVFNAATGDMVRGKTVQTYTTVYEASSDPEAPEMLPGGGDA